MNAIKITKEMWGWALVEAKKRHPDIIHHFEVEHLTSTERDQIGFVGEFAACELFGIDWKKNIRPDYKTIDSHDLIIKEKKIDVKTETVPQSFVHPVSSRVIADDVLFGRRLINSGQANLLKKYDIILFGLIDRDKKDLWYPIGWIEAGKILKDYPPTFDRPDGGKYPFKAFPVRTSELKDIKELLP